ncbi:hypothetical protein [uncultured Thalassospira sp.]|jgi:hypothetical protein|tara:strand:+ start:2417 stop:2539 length:123 start_codon:yes stop_codon:yes gene_type:complete
MAQVQNSKTQRLLWFAGLYLAGLGTLTIVAYGLRALMGLN